MPVIELDYSRQYKEMIELKFSNEVMKDYEIKVMQ